MSFSSGPFLIFMLAFSGLFFVVKGNARKWVLLLASYFFYGIHEPAFVVLIALSTLTDFICAQQIEKAAQKVQKSLWLVASLVVNLGLLGWFKYSNFFHELIFNPADIGDFNGFSAGKYLIPIGISFYTFQTIGYTIDVYRGQIKAERNALDFFVFISFFPQLIAGPIERYQKLMPQLKQVGNAVIGNFKEASSLIIWGLFKKIVIADRLGVLVDKIFEHPDYFSSLTLFGGGLLFLIQIYADFSGYTLIARGLAKTINVDLSMNWGFPLFRSSIRKFWQSWHMTLTGWFRDYVYKPLGGNRKGSFLLMFNIILVFLLSGLWHGANITFVILGVCNALLLIFEIFVLRKLKIRFPVWLSIPIVIVLQAALFIAFRAESTNDLFAHFGLMFDSEFFNFRGDVVSFDMWWFSHITNLIMLLLFFVFELKSFRTYESEKRNYPLFRWPAVLCLMILILFVGEFGQTPFIYFQF